MFAFDQEEPDACWRGMPIGKTPCRGFAYENSVWTTRQRVNGEAVKQHANDEAARQCVNSEAAG